MSSSTDHKYLATYLNDHLAGAVGALELLATLNKAYEGTPVGNFLSTLRAEIEGERRHLESLCEKFPIKTAIPRQIVSWLSEKGLELKLLLDGTAESNFRLFEALEAISVGIGGKRLLWRTLARERKTHPALRGINYVELVNKSVRQRKALEPFRLQAARAAF